MSLNSSILHQRLYELGVAITSAGNTVAEAQCRSNLIQIAVARAQGLELPPEIELDELEQLRRIDQEEDCWQVQAAKAN